MINHSIHWIQFIGIYPLLKQIHVTAVCLSLSLFIGRCTAQWWGISWRQYPVLHWLPHLNDTILLLAALGMLGISGIFPLWVQIKILALVGYVVLGSLALRTNNSKPNILLFGISALTAALFILFVAITHSTKLRENPLGFFHRHPVVPGVAMGIG